MLFRHCRRGRPENSSSRGAGSENKRGSGAGIVILPHGQETDWFEILAEFVVFRVAHYAHHLVDPIAFPRWTLNAERTAHRVFAAEDALRKDLIHDRNFGRS